MMKSGGTFNITRILLGAAFIFSTSPLLAFEVQPENITTIQLDQVHQFSGAHTVKTNLGETTFVVKENDPIVYRVIQDAASKKVRLEPFRDLTKLKGQYRFAKSFIGKNYDLEGVTACKTVVYTVNESSAEIIRADLEYVSTLEVNSENFPDYQYNPGAQLKDGFIGITADCDRQVLYVAKQNNPNMIFVVSLTKKDTEGKYLVVGQYNLSSGSDVEDDISDLFYFGELIYVVRKYGPEVAIVDPTKVCDETNKSCMIAKYDLSAISRITTAKDASGETVGIAEALTVSANPVNGKKVITIYQDQRKNNPANNDKSKDVIFKFEI